MLLGMFGTLTGSATYFCGELAVIMVRTPARFWALIWVGAISPSSRTCLQPRGMLLANTYPIM